MVMCNTQHLLKNPQYSLLKYFVKSTSLWIKSLAFKSTFQMQFSHNAVKWKIYIHISHRKNISSNHLFGNFFTIKVAFKIFFSKMRESELPHHSSVEKREIHCHANFFPSNQFIVNFFSKTLIWRNFCGKIVAVKFWNFHSVCTRHCVTKIYCMAL